MRAWVVYGLELDDGSFAIGGDGLGDRFGRLVGLMPEG